MIQLTPRATEAAKDLLRRRNVPDNVGLKLVKANGDELGLVFASAEPGDTAVPTEEQPTFIVARELTPQLQSAVIDLTDDSDAPQFIVRRASA